MVYLQLFVGISCLVVAVATLMYIGRSNAQPPHAPHSRGFPRNDDDDEDNDNANYTSNQNGNRQKHLGPSKPGDKCIICLSEMTKQTMRIMHCGHAIHRTPCYEEYRKWRRQCPHCQQLVIRIDRPGDPCAICCELMNEENMEYLSCEHALHTSCLEDYRYRNFKNCPVCIRDL